MIIPVMGTTKLMTVRMSRTTLGACSRKKYGYMVNTSENNATSVMTTPRIIAMILCFLFVIVPSPPFLKNN